MRNWVFLGGALALAACGTGAADEADDNSAADAKISVAAVTRVLTTETAKTTEEEWGTFREYFAGETAGVKDLLSGTATIKPGLEIHPPHTHAEEEFLMVVSGEGTWTVEGEDFPAKEGDMLYAKAWDSHGIRNTGDEPLTFVFWKWHSKGVPVPKEPEQQ